MAQVGEQYGGYILDERVGGGAFGEVWKAHRSESLVPISVAIKLLVNVPLSRERFLQEAELWLRASGSPYVVPVQDVGVAGNTYYFVSQYLAEGTLLRRIAAETGQGVPTQQAGRWMEAVLEGLAYLHEQEVMHLDLKPANILMQGNVPRLTDFGISRVLTGSYQRVDAALGTMAYMPPEAFEGVISRQWDVWSAGVLLFELLAGQIPFDDSSLWVLLGAIREGRRRELPPGIPDQLAGVVDRALQVDRKARYPGPREMLADLQAALRDRAPKGPPELAQAAARGAPTDSLRPLPAVPCEVGVPTDLAAPSLRVPPLAPGREAGERAQNPVDGADLVWVPAGEFPMGSSDGDPDEQPVRRVRITKGFWLYRTPVTNAQYGHFLERQRHPRPKYWTSLRFHGSQQPVVGVSWEDAMAYCRWAEGRLPTEAEWEYAARGQERRKYPWGNQEPTAELAVFGQDWSTGRPTAVGSNPAGASWCGALDLAGNVWEWCADWYDPTFYQGRADPQADPVQIEKDSLEFRVLRGGSWSDRPRALHSSYRNGNDPGERGSNVGFRVLRSPY